MGVLWAIPRAPQKEQGKRLSKHQSTCRICGKNTRGEAVCKSCARQSKSIPKGAKSGKNEA